MAKLTIYIRSMLRRALTTCALAAAVLAAAAGGRVEVAGAETAAVRAASEITLPTPALPSVRCDPAAWWYIASDPLHVAGEQMVDARGIRYEPYGLSIMGLQQWNGLDPSIELAVDNQIDAATTSWQVNTIREQVSWALWAQDPTRFWAALDHEVREMTCRGVVVVLNDNVLFTTHEHAPTDNDLAFDEALARRYRTFNNVIIDPFNEPHLNSPSGSPRPQLEWMWHMWQRGGSVNGQHYLGMQTLIDGIRSTGAHNIIWAELPDWARSAKKLARFPLQGENVAIEFHHPTMTDQRGWKRLFQATGQPRIDGEESQYEGDRVECDPSAGRDLKTLLRWLTKFHDGMIAWTLEPNVLVAAEAPTPVTDTIPPWYPTSVDALRQPTTIDANYSCADRGEGMGEIAMSLFKQRAAQSSPYSALSRQLAGALS